MKTPATQTQHQIHRILYVKNFLTGTLAGLQVRCSCTVDHTRCAEVQAQLNDSTPDNPGSDVITGSKWWASGVGCEEVDPGYRLIDLGQDEEHGVFATLDEARAAVQYDRLRAYAIWHNDVRVEYCEPYDGDDDRARQGLGQ